MQLNLKKVALARSFKKEQAKKLDETIQKNYNNKSMVHNDDEDER